MPKLLIIWHSRTGASAKIAKETEQAAKAHIDVSRRRAENVTPSDLIDADIYRFVSPENLASLSGEMKEFFDRCYYPLLEQIEGKPYAQIISAGSDGQGAARQLARIVKGWRLREVQPPLIILSHAQSPAEILAPKQLSANDLKTCRSLAKALAIAAEMGVY